MKNQSRAYRVIPVDFNNAKQRQHLVDLLVAYSADAMGGGKPLDKSVASRSVALLAEKSYAMSFLCYEEKYAVGFANCLETIATFAAQPAINIHDIAVLDTHRRRGISTLLLQAIENYAVQNNYYKMTLEVLEGNTIAQKCYQKLGFSAYQLDPEFGSALFWQKILAA